MFPVDPPVTPDPVGEDQPYVVPAGIVPVGVYEKATPLQEAVASACEAMIAAGLIVTDTLNAEPVQVPDVGVTLYVAVAATDNVLPNVPLS